MHRYRESPLLFSYSFNLANASQTITSVIDHLPEEDSGEEETMLFTQIVPTTSSKTLAARCFFQMLVLTASNIITLQACIPRGSDLVIGRGPVF